MKIQGFCRWVALMILALPLTGQADTQQKDAALWQALKSGGHIAMLRHALAPGFGDPDNFVVDDCSTQRNLSGEGREQAQRIGQRFRQQGIIDAAVYSSQWCRCINTAQELALGAVNRLPVLNSFFGRYERSQTQTEGLQQWLNNRTYSGVTVLVTHQVNIKALTGISPRSGEMVIFRLNDDGEMQVLGAMATELKTL